MAGPGEPERLEVEACGSQLSNAPRLHEVVLELQRAQAGGVLLEQRHQMLVEEIVPPGGREGREGGEAL